MGWTTNTDLPYGIVFDSGAVGYNGKIYIVGGYDGSYYETDKTTEYGPSTGYTTLDTLNEARGRHSIGISGSTIIVAGGNGSDSVEVYDIDATTPQWITKASTIPDGNNRFAGSTVYGDYFYTFGGDSDKVYKYDIGNDSWTTPISDAGLGWSPIVETVGDFIWVIGGNTNRTTIKKYNPSTDDWVTGETYTSPPSDVFYAASCVHGTKIYIVGGYDGGDRDSFISFDTSIPTDANAWDTSLSDMPTGRANAAGAATSTDFYVIAGDGETGDSTANESYDLPVLTPPTNPGGDINPYKTRVRG